MPEPLLTVGTLAAIYAIAKGGSAVSKEAGEVRRSASNVVEFAEQSYALFGDKAEAISRIWAVAGECSQAGWDGEGTEPVDHGAVRVASAIIRSLPDNVQLPEFAAEPDGSLSLDWIQSRRRMFSISVSSSNRLAYAWLDGADSGHAVARFDGANVPSRILHGIQAIIDHGDTSLRAA